MEARGGKRRRELESREREGFREGGGESEVYHLLSCSNSSRVLCFDCVVECFNRITNRLSRRRRRKKGR